MPATKANKAPVARSKSETRTEELRNRLLDAATQFFMEKGFEATNMGEIAALAHASKETFYRHFPNKEDLFRAVILRRAELIAVAFGSVLESDDPPAKALRTIGEMVLTRIISQDTLSLHRVLTMESERFPDLAQLFRESGPKRVHASLTRYLEGQIAKGRLRKMNPSIAARQYFDLVAAEMILNTKVSEKIKPTKAMLRERVDQAIDCFLNGYKA